MLLLLRTLLTPLTYIYNLSLFYSILFPSYKGAPPE